MDLTETVSLHYAYNLDGVEGSTSIETTQTEGLFLQDMAKMFKVFLIQAGFDYVDDVVIEKMDGDMVSATD